MRLAPEGRAFIAAAAILTLLLGALGHWIAFAVALMVTVWVVAFFRDPLREGPWAEHDILAPADGKVVSVIEVDEPAFFGERAVRISIFMNVFDVHVNRYPVSGTVAYRHYIAGRFGHAGTDKASVENEQGSVGLDTTRGKVLVRQIAGLVARRIVTDHDPGTTVRQGERLGMIRFGSRVDLFLPLGTEVLVRPGARTKVAETVVARWR